MGLTINTRFSASRFAMTGPLPALIAALSLPALAEAQTPRFEFSTDTAIDRSDPFIDDDFFNPAGVSSLETNFDTNNWLRYVKPVGGGRVWRFEQQVRLRAFEDRDDLDSILLTPRIQYWAPLGENWQVRGSGAYSWQQRDGDHHFSRGEFEAQARFRGAENKETVFRARITDYDYGDSVVNGLDQLQWRFGIEQHWREANGKHGGQIAGFYTTSEADADRFSFDEWKARARVWHEIATDTRGELRFEAAQREYDGNFSAVLPLVREDTRWEAAVRVEHDISERFIAYAELGYADNDSTIAVRDYSGTTFRVGFRARFRTD